MFNAEVGWFALLGGAALWPISRLVVRARMGRLTPAWNEWAVVQTAAQLEGFMAFGLMALLGALFGRIVPPTTTAFDPMVSMGLHVLAAASAAAAIETVRHPGYVTRLAMILLGVAWLVAGALVFLTAYRPMRTGDETRGLPVAILLGLVAYGFSWWRRCKDDAEVESALE